MVWEKIGLDPACVKETARLYGVDLITSSILIRRNLNNPSSMQFFLEDNLNLLHNSFLFKDMEKAVDRINRAVEKREKIMIFGDRDVDGVTSTVLLVQALREIGCNVDWLLPAGEDDYGLTMEVIEKINAQDYNLLITVDCGISNIEEIALAYKYNIDCIVLDHHNQPNSLPEAEVIINPKVKESGYPFKDLAGCGVVIKLIWALNFSKTDLYRKDIWILFIKPENEAFFVEAVLLRNLVVKERIFESVVPDIADIKKTRLFPLISGKELVVYKRALHEKYLEKIGAADLGLKLKDLQPEIEANFPDFTGKSLLKIREYSSVGKRLGELDTLVDLFRRLKSKNEPSLEEAWIPLLDLAALGTIADMMPLVDENRIIVKRGLEAMNQMKRAGLRELLIRKELYGRRITGKDIGWQVTPVLNSAGRMGEPEKAAQLLLAESSEEIEALINYILCLDRERKKVGDKIWKTYLNEASMSLERTGGHFTIIHGSSIPRGITGILASRLVSYFKLPAVVVSIGERKAVGSLRSPYSLEGFLNGFEDLLINYGGHDCAAGFSLSLELFSEFEKRFYLKAGEHQAPESGEQKLIIDAEVPPEYLNPGLIKVVEFFQPYGEGSPPLVFLTRGVRIEKIDIIGKRESAHVKFLLAIDRFKWPALYWNAAEKAGKEFTINDCADIVYRLSRNYFRNTEKLQLTILDLKISGS